MRWIFWVFAISALMTSVAAADQYDVTKGALITHAPPGIVYTSEYEGYYYCDQYDAVALTDCAGQVTSIPAGADGLVWFVVAAWREAKVFNAVEFGLGTFSTEAYVFADNGTCGIGDPTAVLEIPTGDWPGPNEGTAVAAQGTTPAEVYEGNFVPVYWFAGYSYAATVVPLGINPGTGRVSILQSLEDESWYQVPLSRLGSLGVGTDGVAVCPPEEETGACCEFGGSCSVVTQPACTAAGGTYQGDATTCEPNPCPLDWGCCINLVCFMLTEGDCLASEGFWWEGLVCDSEIGGTLDCENPPDPSENPSWGEVKSYYRSK
ncbi:MAG: hypothetical protein V1774_08465 [Candidatus Eisenbacteria bacterium]